MRIGHGYDVHKLVENRKLILGGVEIPFEKLGITGDEFLIEIEAKIPEVEKYRYPYTLFHSVKPNEIAHMFCRVKKG